MKRSRLSGRGPPEAPKTTEDEKTDSEGFSIPVTDSGRAPTDILLGAGARFCL